MGEREQIFVMENHWLQGGERVGINDIKDKCVL